MLFRSSRLAASRSRARSTAVMAARPALGAATPAPAATDPAETPATPAGGPVVPPTAAAAERPVTRTRPPPPPLEPGWQPFPEPELEAGRALAIRARPPPPPLEPRDPFGALPSQPNHHLGGAQVADRASTSAPPGIVTPPSSALAGGAHAVQPHLRSAGATQASAKAAAFQPRREVRPAHLVGPLGGSYPTLPRLFPPPWRCGCSLGIAQCDNSAISGSDPPRCRDCRDTHLDKESGIFHCICDCFYCEIPESEAEEVSTHLRDSDKADFTSAASGPAGPSLPPQGSDQGHLHRSGSLRLFSPRRSSCCLPCGRPGRPRISTARDIASSSSQRVPGAPDQQLAHIHVILATDGSRIAQDPRQLGFAAWASHGSRDRSFDISGTSTTKVIRRSLSVNATSPVQGSWSQPQRLARTLSATVSPASPGAPSRRSGKRHVDGGTLAHQGFSALPQRSKLRRPTPSRKGRATATAIRRGHGARHTTSPRLLPPCPSAITVDIGVRSRTEPPRALRGRPLRRSGTPLAGNSYWPRLPVLTVGSPPHPDVAGTRPISSQPPPSRGLTQVTPLARPAAPSYGSSPCHLLSHRQRCSPAGQIG
jgi:hypothetical protein